MDSFTLGNDAIIAGILMGMLAIIFKTSNSDHPGWKKFYTYIPSLLLCYFLPSLLNTFGLVDPEASNLYFVASRYFLPASLVLLTLSIDFKQIERLGGKAVIMFFAGTFGIILGGPLAILTVSTVSPDLVGGSGPDAVWRGLATIAGSWIGGGANQAAMLEVFGASPALFSKMIPIDIVVANIWLAFLLFGAGRSDRIDAKLKADNSSIAEVKKKLTEFRESVSRIPSFTDLVSILGWAFGLTALAHLLGDEMLAPYFAANFPKLEQFSLTSGFFWMVILATTFGMLLSLTKAKTLEGAGASKIGSIFLYFLVATIGLSMDVTSIFSNPGLFLIGIIWMIFHISIMILVAKAIKAPFFFVAVGSQANVGGAASAPIVASAFDSALAPVGVLLAVLGYAVGTYGAWLCGILMQMAAP